MCLPKAELTTKNSTKRQLCCCLVEFLVFNSICRLKSDLPKMLNREEYYVTCGWPLSEIEGPFFAPCCALRYDLRYALYVLPRKPAHFKKSDSPKTFYREEYYVICGWPLNL